MANIKAAKDFVNRWSGKGDEKQQTQAFWIELLDKVYEDHSYMDHIQFEVPADKVTGGSNYKDAVINRGTDHAVLIEQKSTQFDLDKKEPRFGSMVTPFEQAKHYDDLSSVTDKARWIITSNFRQWWIYDMSLTGKALYDPVAKINLTDLPNHLDWLKMVVSDDSTKMSFNEEVAVSVEAGRLVGLLYDELLQRYKDPTDVETLKSLNILCVRLVFCLFAEDSGLFNKNNRKMFHDYLAQYKPHQMRKALVDLFDVLNQRIDERDEWLSEDNPLLAEFPYVNGGLFKDPVTIPPFTDNTVDILLNQASLGFDWSKISPTIFGSVFESTLNQETRRSGGMHYTSLENIHKVIDPLFLDQLTHELEQILETKQANVRNRKLDEFQNKLASLRWFDPASGSGNFLTETYLCIRRLENRVIEARLGQGKIAFGFDGDMSQIKVSINQFYGIEINDFAVSVAKTALWIAESLMFEETQRILSSDRDFLPLHDFDNIHEGNALTLSWYDVLDPRDCSYIMGNPPFIGGMYMNRVQKADLEALMKSVKGVGELDYVSGWYWKAAEYIENTDIECAYVSTNSIVQGQQAVTLWKPLFEKGIVINYAYRTFIWDSEANQKAHVHCVIIGFSMKNRMAKFICTGNSKKHVSYINSYLTDVEVPYIESRSNPLCNVPPIRFGSMPRDGGGFILNDDEKDSFIKADKECEKWIRKYLGAVEFLHGKSRWCLWLVNADPVEVSRCKPVMERVDYVRSFRLNSKAAGTRKFAATPTVFCQIAQPDTSYIAVPKTSSEKRKYIPMGFLERDVIASDLLFLIPDAGLYHFGVLESLPHMAWVRAVAGRLKSDYRYAKDIVYNNFIWPVASEKSIKKIEKTAQQILEARAKYPNASLAEMYGEHMFMYPELVNAHKANDVAVMEAYGFKQTLSEEEIVTELMQLYKANTK